mmetsp:Transcript_30049/g.26628  ORF Transcript_30049/g.26628 Transcript_30049/m.26628 type:complete len:97 (+) Transcript_30049:352-642(+)
MDEYGDEQVISMVLGNKQDQEEERVVAEADGAKFARDNNAAFFEVSAKTGYNVNEAIDTLVNEIFTIIPKPERSSHVSSKATTVETNKGCANCTIF